MVTNATNATPSTTPAVHQPSQCNGAVKAIRNNTNETGIDRRCGENVVIARYGGGRKAGVRRQNQPYTVQYRFDRTVDAEIGSQ